jgi:alkylated DNA repair protein alkB homolog 1
MVKRKKQPKPQVNDNASAFRLAERKYKYYKKPSQPPDLSEVIDFWDVSNNTPENQALIQIHSTIERDSCDKPRQINVYQLTNKPGFLFVPKALSAEEQCFYADRCVTEYPHAPNHTNLGFLSESFWIDYIREKDPTSKVQTPMGKLRWVTIGYHYNWTRNIYDESPEWHSEFPEMLNSLTNNFASACGFNDFVPEAGIINYYHVNETMMKAHQDESEFTFDQPIFSFSIGSAAIFLIGGVNTTDPPTAMYLRSGDLVIMGGPSRVYFHGRESRSRICY